MVGLVEFVEGDRESGWMRRRKQLRSFSLVGVDQGTPALGDQVYKDLGNEGSVKPSILGQHETYFSDGRSEAIWRNFLVGLFKVYIWIFFLEHSLSANLINRSVPRAASDQLFVPGSF